MRSGFWARARQRLDAVGRLDHTVAQPGELPADEGHDLRIVVGDEDGPPAPGAGLISHAPTLSGAAVGCQAWRATSESDGGGRMTSAGLRLAGALLALTVLACGGNNGYVPDAGCPECDAGYQDDGGNPEAGLCFGDIPCAPAQVRQPAAACQSAGANQSFVVSTAPHSDGYPETSLALPAVGARVKDPGFGTCVTRATPRGWMNGYSRFTAFNADSSKLLARQSGGAWYLLDYDSLGTPTHDLPAYGDDAAPRWHGRDPDVLFYLDGTTLQRYQVSTSAATVALDVADAAALQGCSIDSISLGGSEGEASAGSRFWGFQVVTAGTCHGGLNHFVTADLETGEMWTHTLPSGVDMPDNSSMSLTGKYFIANFQGQGCSGGGTMAQPCGVMAYLRRFESATLVHEDAGHHDEALSKEGHDVVVVKSNSTDYIEAVDVETGQLTTIAAMNLDAQAWDYHVSGNNWAAPGWVLLSEDSYDTSGHYLSRQIAAVELKGMAGARVVHLAHHRTRSTEYWTQEPHASVNADFTRVAFHSNWYGGADESENILFFLELPPGFLDHL